MSCCVRGGFWIPRGDCDSWSGPAVPVPLGIMLFRADAATRRFIPQDRELCAGEMLRLAGYSAGRSVCARGGRSAGRAVLLECLAFGSRLPCVPAEMSCVWFTPAVRFCWNVWRLVHACRAVLLGCLAFGSRLPCGSVGMSCVWFTPAVRFCWNVWRLVHACRAVLLECLAFGSRLSLFLCQEKRDGLRYVPFLFRRVEIALRAFSNCPYGYRALWVHFGIVRFFRAIPTEVPPTSLRRGLPKKSRRRPESLLGEGQTLNRSYILAP